jgi:hypothetical protein
MSFSEKVGLQFITSRNHCPIQKASSSRETKAMSDTDITSQAQEEFSALEQEDTSTGTEAVTAGNAENGNPSEQAAGGEVESASVQESPTDLMETHRPSSGKPASTRAPKPKKPTAAEQKEQLMSTVSALAESVATLTATVGDLTENPRDRKRRLREERVAATATATRPVATFEGEPIPDNSNADRALLRAGMAFATLLASFGGVGLVAMGSMQHHFEATSLLLMIAGIVLFVVGDTERVRRVEGTRGKAVMAAGSAAAAGGLGMFIGGIQFFDHAGERAAFLVPLGLIFAFIGFVKRSGFRLAAEHSAWAAGVCVWLCLFLGLGLSALAPDDKSDNHEPSGSTSDEVTSTTAATAATATTVVASGESHSSSGGGSGHESTATTKPQSTTSSSAPSSSGAVSTTTTTAAAASHATTTAATAHHESSAGSSHGE